MNKQPTVAISGATGVIGSEIVSIINDMQLPLGEVRLLGSKNSVGEVYDVLDDEVKVNLLESESFEGVDVAIFALPADVVEKYAKKALSAGCVVIDTSTFFRMNDESLLVVPAVNLEEISKETKMIACPNACVVQLAPLLQVVDKLASIKRVVVTSLQPVASAGKVALDELWNQTMAIFRQAEVETEAFQHQIAFNCIPQIGVFSDNGYTKEELSIAAELKRVLKKKDLQISLTAVRIPIFHGSSLVVNIETERALEVSNLNDQLTNVIDLEVMQAYEEYPMPLSVATNAENIIGRIRKTSDNVLDLWISADGIRAGVACGVARILQRIVECHQ